MPTDFAAARLAVFLASIASALIGMAILWGGARRPRSADSAENGNA